MKRYRVPPFEANRILQVVMREPVDGGLLVHFRRRDGESAPFLPSLPASEQDGDWDLLMLDAPVFAAHGINDMGNRFWPCRCEDGIWFVSYEATHWESANPAKS